MPTELRPGAFTELFTRLSAEAVTRVPLALEPLALAVETEAKKNASQGSHSLGTKTPARPGSGPAVISGTLRRSITHTKPEASSGGWQVKVGLATGLHPPGGRTPANKYGYYLEVSGAGRSRVRYPFLKPAFEKVAKVHLVEVFIKVFSAAWH